MAHAESQITIRRPVKDVYAFLLDGSNNPHWRKGVLDIARVPGSPEGVGATWTQGMKGPTGRIAADYTITDCIPNSLIKFEVVAGPARPVGVYTLKSEGNTTSLKFSLDFQPKGLPG